MLTGIARTICGPLVKTSAGGVPCRGRAVVFQSHTKSTLSVYIKSIKTKSKLGLSTSLVVRSIQKLCQMFCVARRSNNFMGYVNYPIIFCFSKRNENFQFYESRWFLQMYQAFLTIVAKKSIPYAFARTLWIRNLSLQSSLFVDEIHYNFRTKTKDFMQIPHGLERGVYLSLITTRKWPRELMGWIFSQLQLSALWLANFICSDHLVCYILRRTQH